MSPKPPSASWGEDNRGSFSKNIYSLILHIFSKNMSSSSLAGCNLNASLLFVPVHDFISPKASLFVSVYFSWLLTTFDLFSFFFSIFNFPLSVTVFFSRFPLPSLLCSPFQPQLLERLLEEIQNLKATVLSQEKRICDLENKLSQYTNGTDWRELWNRCLSLMLLTCASWFKGLNKAMLFSLFF